MLASYLFDCITSDSNAMYISHIHIASSAVAYAKITLAVVCMQGQANPTVKFTLPNFSYSS